MGAVKKAADAAKAAAKKMDEAMRRRMGPQFEKMHKPKPKRGPK